MDGKHWLCIKKITAFSHISLYDFGTDLTAFLFLWFPLGENVNKTAVSSFENSFFLSYVS
jgi:hypothetical protein